MSIINGNNTTIDPKAILGAIGKPGKATKKLRSALADKDVISIGDNCSIRAGAIIYNGVRMGNNVLVADYATIREGVLIGSNTKIGRGVCIENDVVIGRNVSIQSNAYITAYSVIEDDVFVAPGVNTSNDKWCSRGKDREGKHCGVLARKGARIGVGATILPGVELGEECFVGAGSLVTKDVLPFTIVYGVPAKVIGEVPEDQLLKNQ